MLIATTNDYIEIDDKKINEVSYFQNERYCTIEYLNGEYKTIDGVYNILPDKVTIY